MRLERAGQGLSVLRTEGRWTPSQAGSGALGLFPKMLPVSGRWKLGPGRWGLAAWTGWTQ